MKSIYLGFWYAVLISQAWGSSSVDEGTIKQTHQAPIQVTVSHQDSRGTIKAEETHFTGVVHVTRLFEATAPSKVSAATVTFEPGAHTAWHTHPLGQKLIVTSGVGYVQFWDGPVQRISTGDVVLIPPGLKHWHGASEKEAMTHLAIQEQDEGSSVSWNEKVSTQEYDSAVPRVPPISTESKSRAQQLMGDVAPKLALLTDQVLYQDIWERPALSKRDRSLVTVSALISLNRPEQLRSHLALALANGVSPDELVETITHLAFYAGWPSAVSAVGVARDVLPPKPPQKALGQ